MTDKHTPGPWRMGQNGNHRVYGPDGMGEHSGLVAAVYKGRANARLIAAAPDMLGALKIIECEAQSYMSSNAVGISEVRAAIAKAEGNDMSTTE